MNHTFCNSPTQEHALSWFLLHMNMYTMRSETQARAYYYRTNPHWHLQLGYANL